MHAPDPWAVAADLLVPPPRPYANDPVGHARDLLGFTAWSKQREVMESVRDHPKTAVRSCHGVGKTAVAAHIGLWFLDTHGPSCRVITTAPTWSQVKDHLWREKRAAVARAHDQGLLAHIPAPNQTDLELGDQWFAIGQSTDQPERFQGHHAEHLLLIVDEASGVDERIYEAAEGFLTAEGARVLLIGNPTRVGGQFYRAFTQERDTWNTIHISAADSPNYTAERHELPAQVLRRLPRADWMAEKARDWGENSPIYQVRVLGNFSRTADRNVVDLGAVETAQKRELPADSTQDRVVIGCDVARFGDDETVIAERVGQRIRIVEKYRGKDLVHTAERISYWGEKHPTPHVRYVVDDSGLGGGVTDVLRARGIAVTAFNGGNAAHRQGPNGFPNRRSEMWFELAAQLEDLDLDPDDQLAADLSAPEYSLNLKQQRVVEAKDVTKKRLGRSPDRADAVMLTLVTETGAGAVVKQSAPNPYVRSRLDARRLDRPAAAGDILTMPM